MTENLLSRAQGPVVVDHVQHGERHGEQAEQDVSHSYVGNQNVAGRLQQFVPQAGEDDVGIAQEAEQHDDQVGCHEGNVC